MKKIDLILFLTLFSFTTFSQKEYGFDIPWRATSNEHITEWFLDKMDEKCDSAFFRLFQCANALPDSVDWIYPTDILQYLSKNGADYYSTNYYSTNSNTTEVIFKEGFRSQHKLDERTYKLFYSSPDEQGTVFFVLSEYY